ncbi:hypothetical protein L6452_18492 [Arctium lappa]|uniref:Uncharacterized protein n=1 Tax=Arctium lappa TaxID=4217 RepID=A0ACB9C6M3_ARCLA|nr:hypothetical protein L6452_18492 [Arctium lappa]
MDASTFASHVSTLISTNLTSTSPLSTTQMPSEHDSANAKKKISFGDPTKPNLLTNIPKVPKFINQWCLLTTDEPKSDVEVIKSSDPSSKAKDQPLEDHVKEVLYQMDSLKRKVDASAHSKLEYKNQIRPLSLRKSSFVVPPFEPTTEVTPSYMNSHLLNQGLHLIYLLSLNLNDQLSTSLWRKFNISQKKISDAVGNRVKRRSSVDLHIALEPDLNKFKYGSFERKS